MFARTTILALGVAVCLAAGCSDDTGILVEIHGERLELSVARLDTMVILDDGTATRPDQTAWGAADNRQDTVTGVDLRAEPYTVLFRPDGVETDATLWVAAIAYDGSGAVIGFGQLDSMLAFEPDAVLRVQLDLIPAAKLTGDGGDCVVSNGVVVVRTTDDCDGDGAAYDTDCDDLDAQVIADLDEDPAVCQDDCDPTNGQIFPDNQETCDGYDNDCNPDTHAAPELCAVVTAEGPTVATCRIGQRDCLDTDPSMPYDDACRGVTLDPVANSEVCAGWLDCDAGSGANCLVDAQVSCKLKSGDDGACTESAQALHELTDAAQCSWRLVGALSNNGWAIGLRGAGGDQLVTFVDGCDAELVVAASPQLVLPKFVVLDATLDGVQTTVSVLLDPKRADCHPGDNVPLECAVTSGSL